MSEKETSRANLHEQSADVEEFGEIAHERREAIRNAVERAERKQKPHRSEREVLAEARELAKEVEDTNKKNEASSRTEKRRGPITKRQRNASFKAQMNYAASEMSLAERLTSKVIHAKFIEKTADVAGATIARPNAMLSGSIAAFIGITLLYFIAKYYGFRLSGFETLGAFVAGWIVGVLYDYFSVMIRGRK